MRLCRSFFLFFFNDTATPEIYTLSLHDALPICMLSRTGSTARSSRRRYLRSTRIGRHLPSDSGRARSEEHTSELQSRLHLVCRLLLEKKKKTREIRHNTPVTLIIDMTMSHRTDK